MQNPWKTLNTASAASPPPFSTGEPLPPSPIPPDPPDPSSPLAPQQFPPLSVNSKTTPLTSATMKKTQKGRRSSATTGDLQHQTTVSEGSTSMVPETEKTGVNDLNNTVLISGSENTTVSQALPLTLGEGSDTYTILNRTTTSPLITNTASGNFPPTLPAQNFPVLPPNPNQTNLPPTENSSVNPQPPIGPLLPTPETRPLPPKPTSAPTLVEKIRASEDKTLERLAPVTISQSGRPRVLIPDSVFQEGAELHKDFIVCYFNGKSPPFLQIQSVLNHMWGKGKRLEIHNNPINHSCLVRIQSEFLRSKILDKNIWYVGDSMFHTAQWSSEHSKSTPPLKAIKIWAHLTGVPLDLRHKKGLSLVAGLIGHPKETDDFTKDLISITVSHVKVEVDLTQPLPDVVEFERQSGEVVEVLVHYPWLPPTCAHCQELGHIMRNCLTAPPQKDPPPPPKKPVPPMPQKQTQKNPASSRKPVYVKKPSQPSSSNHNPPPPSSSDPQSPAKNPLSNSSTLPILDLRSRSSPTLSPPCSGSSNPSSNLQISFFNPFVNSPLPLFPSAPPNPLTLPFDPSTVSVTRGSSHPDGGASIPSK
ncbi:hypothetical protein Rs2_01077 [Raphanus sativus]|nr:hypothetical protein Rs2_47918 [Raphanus sativus]KAJ4915527.1 hypothetical protein Rs2_01077 [Raphanus sativus]